MSCKTCNTNCIEAGTRDDQMCSAWTKKAIYGEPAPYETGTVCQICNRFIPTPMMRADRWICQECSRRLKKVIYPESDPELCTQDEIQHVGYDDAQCGREK